MGFIRKLCGVAVSTVLAAGAVVAVSPAAFAAPPGYFKIQNTFSNMCLDISGNQTTRKGRAIQTYCLDDPAQFWRWGVAPREDPNALVNLNSQLCLWPNEGRVRDVQYVEQWDCLPTHSAQRWQIYKEDHAKVVRSFDSNFVLSVHAPTDTAGSRVMLYHFHGHKTLDQYWRIHCESAIPVCPGD
ncbi:RICIN domain-containing protein [Lentzea sp. NPDC051213]|uniref:RICIN domain-containing protein n=1 Tax=Lentzea sp. NPDC051213 TaxID=3364126 RepID=UPI003792F1D0